MTWTGLYTEEVEKAYKKCKKEEIKKAKKLLKENGYTVNKIGKVLNSR